MKKKVALAVAVLAGLLVAAGTAVAQSPSGAVVAAVADDSPAHKAGIARGDIIWSVDGRDVSTPRDVVEAVGSRKAGDSVSVRISHGDLTRTVEVTLDARAGRPYMGIVLAAPVAEGDARQPELAALITEVAPGSPAAQAGLKARDLVVSVDGTKLDPEHSLADLIAARKAGDTITLSVASRGGETRDVTATLARNPDKADAAWLGVRFAVVPSFDGSRRLERRPPNAS